MAKRGVAGRNHTTITIPTPLYEKIQAKLRNTSFSSVSEYVTYILRETGSEVAMQKKGKKDVDVLVEKLKALGYE